MKDSSSSTTTSKKMGKQFEAIIGKAFEDYPDTSVDRIPDQTMKYKGRKNVSDFIVFHAPKQYYVECKTVHGNRLPFSNITQFDDLYQKSLILGVKAGVLCWWVDKDVTKWLDINYLNCLRNLGEKSIRYDDSVGKVISGRKKKVYFEYDMRSFFDGGS